MARLEGSELRNARLKANGPSAHDSGMDQSSSAPKSIQDDPRAMRLVDQLKALGYTADDVASAMDEGQDQDSDASSQSAAPAPQMSAPISLPGMR